MHLRPLRPCRNPTPLILLPIRRVTHISRHQNTNDDNIAKHESHKPTHEIEDARNDILREAEDGLQRGEDAVEDAAEDLEEGGEEVGYAVYDRGHCLVVVVSIAYPLYVGRVLVVVLGGICL